MLSNLLTPRQAASLVGVSESTVRRWCDAGLVKTSKTLGGHRRIERQALLGFARSQGLELFNRAALTGVGRGGRLADAEQLSANLAEQLLTGDERAAQQFVVGLYERTGDLAALCDDVLAPALHRVGRDWAAEALAIFREHAATQCALSVLSLLRSRLSEPAADAPAAVCAALSDDPYALAPVMCSLVMKEAGFRTTLLGPDTPADEVLQACIDLSADVVTISVSNEAAFAPLAALCEQLEQQGVWVALGGRSLTAAHRRQLRPDFFGDTMGHLLAYAERVRRRLKTRCDASHPVPPGQKAPQKRAAREETV
jgi:excisionase family DNA binding protein